MKKILFILGLTLAVGLFLCVPARALITRDKTWIEEVLTYGDLNDEFDNALDEIKANKDRILGDDVETSGDYSGHDHEGTNGVQLDTNAIVDDAIKAKHIDANAIVAGAISSNAVEAGDLADDAVEAGDMSDGAAFYLGTFETVRTKAIYSDADTITLRGARYAHIGTTTQMVYWANAITFDLGSGGDNGDSGDLNNNDWHYIYLDDSSIVTKGTAVIDANQIINKTTEPSWSVAKRGWYSGNDRCIFAVRTNGSSQIEEFTHSEDFVQYASYEADNEGGITTTFTDVTLTLPSFCTKASCNAKYYYTGVGPNDTDAYYRTNRESGSGHSIGSVDADLTQSNTFINVLTDTNQVIEIKDLATSTNALYIYTQGWYLPTGM